MKPHYYPIARSGAGILSTMARPHGDHWLRPCLQLLAQGGVTAIVSMLTPGEEAQLGLAAEASTAADLGLEYLSVPIHDFAVPTDDLAEASAWIRAHLESGGHVVVHCKGGIGRSAMMAGAVLVDEGVPPDEAWQRIAEARGLAVPDTESQRDWLANRHRT